LTRTFPDLLAIIIVPYIALLGRAVDQHLAPQISAKPYQTPHDLNGLSANWWICSRNRKAGRRNQQPMQAGNPDAGVRSSAAQTLTLCSTDQMRILSKRKGCQLQAFVTGLLREVALSSKLQIANDFVA